MIDRPAILVVAYSARALASSAARAGFAPLAIDVFGDDDTRETSLACVKLDGGLVFVDRPEYYIDRVDKVLAILLHCVGGDPAAAGAAA